MYTVFSRIFGFANPFHFEINPCALYCSAFEKQPEVNKIAVFDMFFTNKLQTNFRVDFFVKAIFCDYFYYDWFSFPLTINSSHDDTYWKLETWRMDEMHKFKYLPPCAKGYVNIS